MDIHAHNRDAWNAESESGDSEWCQPVDAATIAAARTGDWSVILTPNKPVPRDWFGDIKGARILCLASGGGQQAPMLAAAGATVTSVDLSPAQLAKDAEVAAREGLALETIEADMTAFSDKVGSGYDLVFNATSNLFAGRILPVWRECAAILKPGGRLLAGFMNPDFFLFDHDEVDAGGPLTARFHLPFSAARDLPVGQREERVRRREALEYSHSLEDQIGGQIAAGFTIEGFYEDRWSADATRLDPYMPTSFATLARKSG
ncbi:class I SAM-dependent methyltransferase [Maricaulis maris]|uniref:2-polyprenyl-3-methyl-5-hydroxy-6-metoxy-1, 4-benzoquinol methylase n=1 Tax=Maricaulis maris TaxID=74318 RepID=A0A495DDM1_9PROT|nr:class I SAM-dependent methyltransferase [Maricaulis maris]RKR00391.1 2-polyprenyl-3-methyl-5-hydroxy-6-metoxy-1,4-benzoquinol methylase [Maricaulis maris]